jgi:serine/threonine protein kinase
LKITAREWKQLFGLLDTLLELADDERPALLAKITHDTPHLSEQLHRLLAENANLGASAHDFTSLRLDDNDVIASRQRIKDTAARSEGAEVGPYRLIREIGHGGMSTVWLAVRSDGRMRRPLALKLPHVFMRDGRFADRFDREREILEALTHPNIARLYDAGVSENGQPYLGMEYVEGVSLLEYCNSARLTVRERLQVFLQVLAAVRYAHSQLVIHRDLKPSNILVTAQHQVSLLDFGIAKLTVAGEAQETELTRHGGRALTPDYASPEHIAGLPLSTGSDVYSLGVVLFELLTGQRPYRPKRDSRGALEDAILSADAPHLEQSAAAGQAELCNMSRAQLMKELRGDLDSIVQKALKKSPADRYGTADTFAQDLERYLSNETVFARPDSAWYRTAKLLRRNKLLVGAVAAVILALSAGLGVALWQASLARDEAHTAAAVQAFMENMFRANSVNQPDPIKARQTTARELLDVGTAQIDGALNEIPEAKLRVLKTLEDMYDELGVSDQMLALGRKRVDIARTLSGRNGRIMLAETLLQLGNAAERVDLHAEAERALTEAEGILDGIGDQRSQSRAELENALAYYYDGIDVEKALVHGERAVSVWRTLPKSTYNLVNALAGQAMFNVDTGHFAAAETTATEALSLAQGLGAAANDQLTTINTALGYAHWGLGSVGLAERDFRRVEQIAVAGTGDVVMQTLNAEGMLADFLIDTARVHDGLAILETQHGGVAKLTGIRAASSRSARTMLRYGRALVNYGLLESGIDTMARVLTLGPGFTPTPEFMSKLLDARAGGMIEIGHYAEAESLLALSAQAHHQAGESLTIYQNPTVVLQTRLLLALGRAAEAASVFRTYRNGEDKPADITRQRVEPLIVRAELAVAGGDADSAIRDANQALTLVSSSANRKYLSSWEMQGSLLAGKAELASGRANNALPLLTRALELGGDLYDQNASPRYADAQIALAECLLVLGRVDDAKKLYMGASAIHITHRELAEHYRKPLQHLKTRLAQL